MSDFHQVRPGQFAEATESLRLESPLHAENVDPCGDIAAYDGIRCFMSPLSGYAITADGELKFVWSVGRGQGDSIVADAVRRGAKHLNCFDGHLSALYARHGFAVTERLENWDPEGPDVVTMRKD